MIRQNDPGEENDEAHHCRVLEVGDLHLARSELHAPTDRGMRRRWFEAHRLPIRRLDILHKRVLHQVSFSLDPTSGGVCHRFEDLDRPVSIHAGRFRLVIICNSSPKGIVRFWSRWRAPPYGEIHRSPPCCTTRSGQYLFD